VVNPPEIPSHMHPSWQWGWWSWRGSVRGGQGCV
jgi:hypothetical protein